MAKRVLITTDRIGRGDDDLGRLIVRNFCYALARAEERPAALMLMNGGVRLACEGSEVLDDLRLMVDNGVAVKVCGTCLDYLEIADTLEVGEVGTMVDAVAAFLGEGEIVTVS